jgi:cysteinyl-tRNA synthetase, unknown class
VTKAVLVALSLAVLATGGCTSATSDDSATVPGATVPGATVPGATVPGQVTSGSVAPASMPAITSWVYQLQGYEDGRLDALGRAPQQMAVIDLARDGQADYFRPEEIAGLRGTNKRVLAYFEIGSIEDFRPEHASLRRDAGDLVLNRWDEWPEEHFVRYWDPRWWHRVIQPRIDQALDAGFDGVYLDTPLAYEQIDVALTTGWTRDRLGRAMVDLIIRMSQYAKARDPDFWIVPQNSPELRDYAGYTEAIDGIGMEELFFQATDEACVEEFCAENLDNARALRNAGKLVLAVDYASDHRNVRAACARYRSEGFAGYVGPRELDRISPPCAHDR